MNHSMHHTTTDTTATFSTDVTGLADATRPEVVTLDDGDTFELRIASVAKNLDGDRVRMLSYNASIPGPIRQRDAHWRRDEPRARRPGR